MKLSDYRKKRNPALTNEPFGDDPPAGTVAVHGAFVVHLHDATNLHYDLRLEMGGVLASFAVPKGPSLDPVEKRFAAHTEDHPLEYLDFEDVIPRGQYGAGPMIVWDRGSVEFLDGTAEDGIARGKLDFVLTGYKLHGRFALVQLKSGAGKDWLLIKKKDAYSSEGGDILIDQPRSVLSGLAIDELEGASALGAALEARAAALGAGRAATGLSPSPMVAKQARAAVTEPGFVHEVMLDGIRIIGAKREAEATRASVLAEGRDLSDLFPEVARAIQALSPERVILDGEIVAFEDGRPNRARLARRMSEGFVADVPVICMLSDLLVVGARDLRRLPLEKRRALLAELLPAPGVLRVSESIDGDPMPLIAFCTKHDLDGIVSKEKSSRYLEGPKPNAAWRALRLTTRLPGALDVPAEAPVSIRSRKVTFTNRQKLFWPDEGYTKGDLCDYYEAIAPTLVPYLRDRPIIVVRYPDGIAGKNFFQWNVPPGMPSWIQSFSLKEDAEGHKRVFMVNDAPSLLYLANLACIPIHILGCRRDTLDACDFFTIDFDLKLARFVHAVTLATTLRELLYAIGLTGFPKSSGQSGLHVLVPLGAGVSFATARALTELLGRLIVARHPDIATMERVIARRGERVYVDTGQTGPTRAIVSPYSVRAHPGATVSTPLTWDEVTPTLDPSGFTIRTVPDRVARLGDIMRPLLEAKPDVAGAVEKLGTLVALSS